MKRPTGARLVLGLWGVFWLVGGVCASLAQDPEATVPVLPETVVRAVEPAYAPTAGAGTVFEPTGAAESPLGGFEAVFDTPGSGAYLGPSNIHTQSYDNVERVLQQVPGVSVRTENGYGHFPSISMRGVESTRSGKLTVMEDGVLIAPAPYSAPAVYYFPNVGRMHAVEVIKGHSQIMYGPHTVAGALNLISTPIPEEPSVSIRGLYGSHDEYRMHAWFGSTVQTRWGRMGYLLEGYLRESDGFKTINQPPGLASPNPFSRVGKTQDAGFTDGDLMLKFFWEPDSLVYQRWEVKVGYADSDRNETYLGLSDPDFVSNPFQRYPASVFDNWAAEHTTTYLRYTLGDPEWDRLSITNTVYYNQFHRNWYKLQDLRNIDTDTDGVGDGVNMNLGAATGGALAGAGLEVLRGQRAGTWRVRTNNRDYYSHGNETVASLSFDTRRAAHDVKAAVRYHVDEIRPFQHDDQFTIDSQGFITATSFGAPGSQRSREQEAHATAFYLLDRISLGRLSVTPGIRMEHIHLSTIDFGGSDTVLTDNLDVIGGGVGATYDLSDRLKLLAGFHRGYSPPSPRGATGQGTGGERLKEEEALASEFGFRYLNAERAFGTQLIAFYTQFNNMIIFDIMAVGGGTGNAQNVGAAFASGIEFTIQYDPGVDRGWTFQNPWFLAATYTNARLLEDVASADPESFFAGGRRGAWLPYVPEWAFTMGTGVHFDLIGVDVTGIFVDETFTTASNNTDHVAPDGTPDARVGKTDDYFIWDFSGYARLTDKIKLFGGIQNVFDLDYLSSRHPYGPRPGAPLFGYLGAEAVY